MYSNYIVTGEKFIYGNNYFRETRATKEVLCARV